MELHQFRKEPSYELVSENGNVDGQTNRQKTDKRTDRITPILKGT